ncbi:MAG: MFS transporter [Acidobacteriia bacterium]|nr:MFS transporter [Terriglobia bacterium]
MTNPPTPANTQTAIAPRFRLAHLRWYICALLFMATTVNYLDRIVFSVLIPVIRDEMHISNQQYGYINGAFQAAYTIGFLFMGRFIDRIGTRIGYAVSIAWWSLAAAFHALTGSALSLGFWRGMLGLGESGNFPAAIKSVAEWFPKRDRAFATGVFNAGTNVASMIGPPIIVGMLSWWGWRGCFLVTSSLGFVWLVLWLISYRLPQAHPKISRVELDYIQSDLEEDSEEATIGWLAALRYKQTWGFALAKFLTDPVWWFYLYWLPPYLYDVRGFNLTEIGWALPVVYLMADAGSVGGGWLPGYLMRRGWPHGKARKATMALFACLMPIAALSALAPHSVLAIALISLATSSHQGWSANLFTTTSDVFPKKAVASVTGIGGTMGGLGGFLLSAIIPGFVVTHFGYTPLILGFGFFHLTALLIVHRLLGDMRRITL